MKNTSNKRTNVFSTLKIFTGYFSRFQEDNSFNSRPKMAFLVIKKRISFRAFLENAETKKLENPMPGTVFDRDVTMPDQ